jgi:acetoacetate decarboxylase
MTYRTDPEKLRAVVPDPLQIDEPLVEFEFIRMPDSTDFGDYTESGQVIPVRFWKETGGYSDAMYLNDGPPIFGPVLIATGTMGFKHVAVEPGTACSRRLPHRTSS